MDHRNLIIAGLAAAVAACGGGGSDAPSSGTAASPLPPPPPAVPQTRRDVVFAQGATTSGRIDLTLDIVQSGRACGEPRPYVILVHGGGYSGGSKDSPIWQDTADALAARNLIAIPISYRLTGDGPIPGEAYQPLVDTLLIQAGFMPATPAQALLIDTIASAAEDTLAAVNWVRDNAVDLCADPDRFAVWGSSAGAYNTHAFVYSLDEVSIDVPRPDAAIGYWGGEIVFDAMQPDDTPMLIVHGTGDQTVAYDDALELEDDLQNNAIPYTFYTVEGAGHGWGSVDPMNIRIDGVSIFDRTLDFIEDHVNGRDARYEVRRVALTSSTSTVVGPVKIGRARSITPPLSNQPSGIEIQMPTGQVGANDSGVSTLIPLQATQQMHLSYRVQFPHDFDFSTRGVLPGLSGGQPEALRSQFDRQGWSASLGWNRDGHVRPIWRAESFTWRQAAATSQPLRVRFEPGRTHAVELSIEPEGSAAGEYLATVWLDGHRVVSQTFAAGTPPQPIDAVLLSAFVDGDGHNHGPRRDISLQLTDITISTAPIRPE